MGDDNDFNHIYNDERYYITNINQRLDLHQYYFGILSKRNINMNLNLAWETTQYQQTFMVRRADESHLGRVQQ